MNLPYCLVIENQHKKSNNFFFDSPHPAEYFAMDSVTMHTIKLIQHARKVRTLIQNAQQILESVVSSECLSVFSFKSQLCVNVQSTYKDIKRDVHLLS